MTQILPSPPPIELLALVILSYLAGAVTPWYFMQERIRGFGRGVTMKLLFLYEPPPGEEAGQAMQDAVEAGETTPDAEGSDGA
jgi:hypothetical protein